MVLSIFNMSVDRFLTLVAYIKVKLGKIMKEHLILFMFLLFIFGSLSLAGLMTKEEHLASLTGVFRHEKESGSDLSVVYTNVPKLFLANVSNNTFEYFEVDISLKFNDAKKVRAGTMAKLVDRYVSKLYGNIPVSGDGNLEVEKLREVILFSTQEVLGSEAGTLEAVLFNSIKQSRRRQV
jgi:hypothetical protein